MAVVKKKRRDRKKRCRSEGRDDRLLAKLYKYWRTHCGPTAEKNQV
jgi:hypothetical protein